MRPLRLLGLGLLPSITIQIFILKCNDAGDRRPNVSINPRVYPSLSAICEFGAGCTCGTTGSVICQSSPSHSVHMIFTAFQDYCVDHCECVSLGSDTKDRDFEIIPASRYSKPSKENMNPNNRAPHTCSGTCSEVARACSWAYTGECMCTASTTPDPWGLFASHGCVAVIAASQLAGRDMLHGNFSDPDSSSSSSTASNSSSKSTAVDQTDSIVKGPHGFYNASTGIQVACPCNSTCVSYGCCGSDGMTFQPADTCLGKLDIVNGR